MNVLDAQRETAKWLNEETGTPPYEAIAVLTHFVDRITDERTDVDLDDDPND